MKKVILLALLAVVFVAMPAFAAVQNVKVSGDINSAYVYRNQFDFGKNTGSQTGTNTQSFFMTQTTVRVDADLTDKVMATVQLLNERAWGNDGKSETGSSLSNGESNAQVDVNLAYVTIKEMLYSPLTVIVGRQQFAYGNSFVIDSAGTNNVTTAGGLKNIAADLSKHTALDAIRAILDYNPLTIDLVYAKIDANNLQSTGAQKDDIDLFGTNVNYKLGDKNNTVLEGYFWAKVDNSNSNANTGIKANTVYMPGVHASTDLGGLMLSGEMAWQRGTIDYADLTGSTPNGQRSAFAYQAIASYQLPFESTKKYAPVATGVFTHVSGDPNPTTSTKNHQWDPMLEHQGTGRIYNALLNLTDSNIATFRGSVKPIEDVTLAAEMNSLWLDKKASVIPLVEPDGTGFNATSTGKRFLGNEYDLDLAYAYTEDVTIGATLGLFSPGKAFVTAAKKDATQAMVNCDVKF